MPAEALKGHLDALVLAIVAAGPAHGYSIMEQLRVRSGGVFDLPEGTIYPALHRLEGAGLLDSIWTTEHGRRRRIYHLTGKGRDALGARRADWQEFSRAVGAVLA